MSKYKPLEETIIHLIKHHNFYAQLILLMDKKLDNTTQIAGVSVTDRINLYVNPDYFNGLTLAERTAVLMHECEHIYRDHISRSKAISDKWTQDLNIAADRAINSGIHTSTDEGLIKVHDVLSKKMKMVDPKTKQEVEIEVKPVTKRNFDEKYQVNSADNLTMEEYYRIIKNAKQDGKGDSGDEDGDLGMDDHGRWSEGENNPEITREIIRNAVNKAASRTAGNIPGEVQLAINELNRSVVNWKHVLQRFTAKCVQMNIDSSRKRRSRKYGIIHPGTIKEPILRLGVAMDTSGSVDDQYIRQFISEIKKIHALGIEVYIVEADCTVQAAFEYDPKKPFVIKGRGGTAFQPAINELLRIECDAIVYFTDGDCYDKVQCKKPLLWALCPRYNIPVGGEKNHIKITDEKRA